MSTWVKMTSLVVYTDHFDKAGLVHSTLGATLLQLNELASYKALGLQDKRVVNHVITVITC